MTNVEVYDLAYRYNCVIDRLSLPESSSVSVNMFGKSFIGLDSGLPDYEEKEILCHEIGHHAYAGLYTEKTPYETIDRIEHRANKWTYIKLMPIGELREALNDPFCRTVPEVADKFGVTEDFARDAISYYAECAGLL